MLQLQFPVWESTVGQRHLELQSGVCSQSGDCPALPLLWLLAPALWEIHITAQFFQTLGVGHRDPEVARLTVVHTGEVQVHVEEVHARLPDLQPVLHTAEHIVTAHRPPIDKGDLGPVHSVIVQLT